MQCEIEKGKITYIYKKKAMAIFFFRKLDTKKMAEHDTAIIENSTHIVNIQSKAFESQDC